MSKRVSFHFSGCGFRKRVGHNHKACYLQVERLVFVERGKFVFEHAHVQKSVLVSHKQCYFAVFEGKRDVVGFECDGKFFFPFGQENLVAVFKHENILLRPVI